MAILCTDRVAIRGISACVPSKIENTDKVYSKWGGGEQFASTVGSVNCRSALLLCTCRHRRIWDMCFCRQSCMTIDISLGCSGWVYALSVIASLMECSQIKKGLLLAGDTLSKICSADDKSTYRTCLFLRHIRQ